MHRSSFALSLAAAIALLGSVATAPAPARAAAAPVNVAIVTDLGTIDVVLDPVHAPITTKNFLKLVDGKFYTGGTFFRAIPGFVIQGGNKSKETPSDQMIRLEAPLKTGVLNVDGAIAMARTNDPNSATSEFFIDDGAQPRLDSMGYAAFGHVTKNLELVRKIARGPVDGDQLVTPVKILRIVRLP
jgi:peptidyl-prolyl cis-trans isomerase A (cyclophilin A)